jgi:hypothetical protein
MYVMDASTPRRSNWKRDCALRVYPFLPHSAQVRIDLRIRNFRVSEEALLAVLDRSRFEYTIVRTRDVDPTRETWRRLFFLCELSPRPAS